MTFESDMLAEASLFLSVPTYRYENEMYQAYKDFKIPPLNKGLWRYLDFTKFVSLLDTKALFFARIDTLEDPFEGTLFRAIEDRCSPEIIRDVEKLRRWVGVNCWHANNYESDAMWKMYGAKTGVAIRTTCQGLINSFTGTSSAVHIGQVQYVDYETFNVPLEDVADNLLRFLFLYKRKHFEHEREVRALTHDIPRGNDPIDLSEPVWDGGKPCKVDLNQLVDEVVISPLAQPWFIELVTSVAGKYGLSAEVRQSSMSESPVSV